LKNSSGLGPTLILGTHGVLEGYKAPISHKTTTANVKIKNSTSKTLPNCPIIYKSRTSIGRVQTAPRTPLHRVGNVVIG